MMTKILVLFTILLLILPCVLAETSTSFSGTGYIPLVLAVIGLVFLGASFFKKIWPMPLIAFILLIAATIIGLGFDVVICETNSTINAVNATTNCITQTTYTGALTYVFGGLAILALVLLFLRILEGYGIKNQEY
jgi:hypothetical protein